MSVSRRSFLWGGLTLPAVAAKKPVPVKPNIVLILVDYLPSWALGAYGNKEIQSPNLDRLAQMGTRFLNHEVCTPAAALSRATMLSGLTPMQLGDAENGGAGASPLEKALSGAGYGTKTTDTAGALAYLDQQTPGKPFFVMAGFPGMHPPHEGIPQKFRDLYGTTKFDTLDLQRTAAPNARVGKEMFGDLAGNVRKFAAAVSALDADVAAMLAKLGQRSLMDGTLIIFTSSCGSLLGRHGLWDSGQASEPVNMYEEAVATPLFWSWPGHVPAQAVRPELVSAYDLVPSICDLVGTDPPSGGLCGRSYELLATGKPLPKKQPWRTTVFGHYQDTDMARVERYKLVSRNGGNGPGELYDLVQDPVEKVNQYENQQFLSVRTGLGDSLSKWKQAYSARAQG
jgi:arylsulfatase A-like enzyme